MALLDKCVRSVRCFIVFVAGEHDIDETVSMTLSGVDFLRRGDRWHEDCAACVKKVACRGDPLCVIPGAGTNDSTRTFFRGECEHFGRTAAPFIGTHWLRAFILNEDGAAADCAQAFRSHE